MSIANKFEVINGMTNATYNDTEKVTMGADLVQMLLHLRVGTNPIYFSFNGAEDHGVIGANTGYIQSIQMDIGRGQIWFRGGSGDEEVQVWGWA